MEYASARDFFKEKMHYIFEYVKKMLYFCSVFEQIVN